MCLDDGAGWAAGDGLRTGVVGGMGGRIRQAR